MKSKVVLTASAILLFTLGIVLDFMPQEVGAAFGMGVAPMTSVALQVLAAAFLGMGFLNWLSKGNPMGGIYSRPLALQNFLLFGVAGIALDRAALHGTIPRGILCAAFVFTAFAIAFAWLLFVHDPLANAQPEQKHS